MERCGSGGHSSQSRGEDSYEKSLVAGHLHDGVPIARQSAIARKGARDLFREDPVDQTMTLKALAVKTGLADSVISAETYTLTTAVPAMSPNAGTYNANQNVTITSASAGVTIHYTTDGTTPDETSTTYTGPVAVTESLSLRALAVRTGWSTGNVTIRTYTMVEKNAHEVCE